MGGRDSENVSSTGDWEKADEKGVSSRGAMTYSHEELVSGVTMADDILFVLSNRHAGRLVGGWGMWIVVDSMATGDGREAH